MRNKIIFLSCILLISTAVVGFFFSPYWAVHNIRQAALEKDAAALSDHVDYPALRESLKANVNALLAQEVAKKSDNPLEAFGAALAAAFVNPLIDALVTPESLTMLLAGEKPDVRKLGAAAWNKPSSPKAEGKPAETSDVDMTGRYESLNRFIVKVKEKGSSGPPVELVLIRHGLLSWKLSALRLPFLAKDMHSKPAIPTAAPAPQQARAPRGKTAHVAT